MMCCAPTPAGVGGSCTGCKVPSCCDSKSGGPIGGGGLGGGTGRLGPVQLMMRLPSGKFETSGTGDGGESGGAIGGAPELDNCCGPALLSPLAPAAATTGG